MNWKIAFFIWIGLASLLGQTNSSPRGPFPFLPENGSNMVVIAEAFTTGKPTPVPPEYDNVLSNTNLFSPAEQELLKDIPRKYKAVTTDAGPSGSLLITLTNSTKGFVARFQYTNSEASEVVTFGGMKSIKFRTGSGDGYDVDLNPKDGAVLNFQQIRHNVVDGLFVTFYEGRCINFMRFEEGKAVGKWLMWGEEDKLFLHAEFKGPYDLFKHAPHYRLQR